jgi:MFS family permease
MLGVGVMKVGTRAMLVIGASAWLMRALLLAWMSQSVPSGQLAIACLFGAQVLQGVAIAAFFGTLGVVLRSHHEVAACRYQIMLVAVCGILGMLIGGVIADDILGGTSGFILTQLLELVGLSTADNPGVAIWLQGWAGVWCLSAVPCLLAIPLAGLSKASSISLECLR